MLHEFLIAQCAEEQKKLIEEEKAANLPKVRMYASEREAYMRLLMCSNIVDAMCEDLKRRTEIIPDLANDLKMISEMMRKYLKLIKFTIPFEQRKTIDNNADNCTYTIGVRTPGSVGKRMSNDFGIIIGFSDMGVILNALHDHCLTCAYDKTEEGKCELRKVFDRIGVDMEHEDGRCGYRQYM